MANGKMQFFYKFIATAFGSGYSPLAPGTAGAAVGVLMLWGMSEAWPRQFSGGWPQAHWLLVAILVFFFLGVVASQKLEPEWGHDPSRITVDELVGVWVAMLGVPVNWLNLLLAFGLFRLFDIWKPLGIRKLEKLPGGWGVMLDDVAAGVVAGICLHLILLVLHTTN